MNLEGKRALITGASGALGAAMAERLARDGATVLLHANSRPEAVEQLAATIAAAGGKAECHVFDLRSDEHINLNSQQTRKRKKNNIQNKLQNETNP